MDVDIDGTVSRAMPQNPRVMGSNPTAAICCGHMVVDMFLVRSVKLFQNKLKKFILHTDNLSEAFDDTYNTKYLKTTR